MIITQVVADTPAMRTANNNTKNQSSVLYNQIKDRDAPALSRTGSNSDFAPQQPQQLPQQQQSSYVAEPSYDAQPQAAATANADSEPRFSYKANFTYAPEADDELTFHVGDIIVDAHLISEGWLMGTHQQTGKTGLFPEVNTLLLKTLQLTDQGTHSLLLLSIVIYSRKSSSIHIRYISLITHIGIARSYSSFRLLSSIMSYTDNLHLFRSLYTSSGLCKRFNISFTISACGFVSISSDVHCIEIGAGNSWAPLRVFFCRYLNLRDGLWNSVPLPIYIR